MSTTITGPDGKPPDFRSYQKYQKCGQAPELRLFGQAQLSRTRAPLFGQAPKILVSGQAQLKVDLRNRRWRSRSGLQNLLQKLEC